MAIFTFILKDRRFVRFFRRILKEFSICQTLVIKGCVYAVVSSMIFSSKKSDRKHEVQVLLFDFHDLKVDRKTPEKSKTFVKGAIKRINPYIFLSSKLR